MSYIRYTDPARRVSILEADSLKQARRLYNYAVKVATAQFKIELIHNDEVRAAYVVPSSF